MAVGESGSARPGVSPLVVQSWGGVRGTGGGGGGGGGGVAMYQKLFLHVDKDVVVPGLREGVSALARKGVLR